jgi:hypothetical protein
MAKRQKLSTKDYRYIEILRLSTTNPTKNGGELRTFESDPLTELMN